MLVEAKVDLKGSLAANDHNRSISVTNFQASKKSKYDAAALKLPNLAQLRFSSIN